ncbi:MAG: hypothetical protein BWK80_62330 [Desulfobacteraceae bacterium IS3]|nr:MAG: hypothetical protein BWK80_62330 [Desulfobacteraceae bacterium IS3]
MKKKGIFTGCFTLLALLFSAAAFAGSLDAPSAPGSTGSYTLDAIWNRLNDGTDGSQSTFTEPGATPAPTGHTINDVMTKAPAKDDTNGATPADVLSGKTFWGLTSGAWGLQTGTAASLPTETVRKTGQTGCWNAGGTSIACAGTGQDGELQKGAALPSPRFTDNSNGTVTDNLTGLIWLKNANCWGQIDWATATSNAAALANGSCGLTDGSTAGQWRLPNVKELRSLIHFGYFNPALSNDAGDDKWGNGTSSFTGVQTSLYWLATTTAGSATSAWDVNLYFGNVAIDVKTRTCYVWPVR